jgi:hypothetical protein
MFHSKEVCRMSRSFSSVAWAWCLISAAAWAADKEQAAAPQGSEIQWQDDYTEATRQAVSARKMLCIYFHDPKQGSIHAAFQQRSLADAVLEPFVERYVWVKAPTHATITLDGTPTRILSHAAFREMHQQPGIAIVDYHTADRGIYGRVVSAFAFPRGTYYGPRALTVILDLPSGTLTQRTMVYAVRMHPESPASARGTMSRTLASEAQSHSSHQASIGVQGHHNWDSRFHRINGKLGGLTSQEVVAESWPNENLVEACVDCVHSWRQSPGHWSAVRGRHRMFGYDIKRGSNGIWYATGLFAR